MKKKKLFVVSDIHGHYTLLKEALDKAGFDPKNKEHLLVGCGDYFDRGTENLQVLKYLDCLENKVLLQGNHEELLLQVLRTGQLQTHNLINGSLQTVTELFGKYVVDAYFRIDFSGKTRIAERMENFIRDTLDFFETENYIFVHAWLPTVDVDGVPRIAPDWCYATERQWAKARWRRWTDMYRTCDRPDKTIVCGHVPTFFAHQFDPARDPDDAGIFYGDGVIAIDAGTASSQKLNVLVLEENVY